MDERESVCVECNRARRYCVCDDEYDPPEPSRTIVVTDRSKLGDQLRPTTLGYTHVIDADGNKIMTISLPSRRMRFITKSDALWADLHEVLEDVAVAFRNRVTRDEFSKAVESILHILNE